MCRYCERKPILDGIWGFSREDNSCNITDGRWTSMRAGVNRDGHFVMYAVGDDETDDFVPEWCPFCGRHLHKINDNGEWELL